ncbi:hypothetical protein D3C85_1631090 [compost metagenome]
MNKIVTFSEVSVDPPVVPLFRLPRLQMINIVFQGGVGRNRLPGCRSKNRELIRPAERVALEISLCCD